MIQDLTHSSDISLVNINRSLRLALKVKDTAIIF